MEAIKTWGWKWKIGLKWIIADELLIKCANFKFKLHRKQNTSEKNGIDDEKFIEIVENCAENLPWIEFSQEII